MLVLNVKMLYYYGNLPKKCPTVAIVGSRKNTTYGYEVAYNAAYQAAKAGAVVVSGLAYGIDSIAHRGALDAGGITVAVLGTPITEIYPKAHVGLAKEIIKSGGAIISEYGPADLPSGKTETMVRFLHRNRIISGLSDVVLVAEAADRSGSLNTATHALGQGKELLVAPGDITKESSRGCNKLLAQGALAYTCPEDLLDLLQAVKERKVNSQNLGSDSNTSPTAGSNTNLSASSRAQKIIKAINDSAKDPAKDRLSRLASRLETDLERNIAALILTGVQDGDKIMQALNIPVSSFNQTITILEIKGVVKSLGMNRWMVNG